MTHSKTCSFPTSPQTLFSAYFMSISSSILAFSHVNIYSFSPFFFVLHSLHSSLCECEHMHTFMPFPFLLLDSFLQCITGFSHFHPLLPSIFPHSPIEPLLPNKFSSKLVCLFFCVWPTAFNYSDFHEHVWEIICWGMDYSTEESDTSLPATITCQWSPKDDGVSWPLPPSIMKCCWWTFLCRSCVGNHSCMSSWPIMSRRDCSIALHPIHQFLHSF